MDTNNDHNNINDDNEIQAVPVAPSWATACAQCATNRFCAPCIHRARTIAIQPMITFVTQTINMISIMTGTLNTKLQYSKSYDDNHSGNHNNSDDINDHDTQKHNHANIND